MFVSQNLKETREGPMLLCEGSGFLGVGKNRGSLWKKHTRKGKGNNMFGAQQVSGELEEMGKK